ncbi:MAG: acyl-CoA dehydrogenase [Gammaproteobacteria bacterium]|nr:acyl-CoA dehydrogenase [Gammaproteobacteria bacterium]
MNDKTFLSWPFFSEQHRSLSEEVSLWAETHCAEFQHNNVDESCRQLVSALAKTSFLQYCSPERHSENGQAFDVRALCIIRETLAYYSGLADFSFAMQGLGSGPITLFGSALLKDNYLDDVRQGRKIAAFALSEPDAGSDVAALTTNATKDKDTYVLNGEKTWISNGGIADFYIVFARTGEASGAKGLSAFVVDADNPGLSIKERIDVIAPHPLATIEFSDCKVSDLSLLGNRGDGFKIAMSTLDIFRSTVGAAALGFARRALDETLKQVKQRHLFGAPMADLQLTQASLGEMALAIDASALLIYRAAWTKDCVADRVTREAAMAKLHATEAAQKVIDQAVQLFGGRGVKSGEKVEELYREIRALRIYEGASEVQKLIIARQTLNS